MTCIHRPAWPLCIATLCASLSSYSPRPAIADNAFDPNPCADVSASLCHAIECPLCVVHIRVEKVPGAVRYGTGVLLEDGRVVTAAHVLRDAKPATVHVIFGGRNERAEYDAAQNHKLQIRQNEAEDWAILSGLDVPAWAHGVRRATKPTPANAVLTSVGLEAPDAVRVHAGKMLGRDSAGTKLCMGVTTQQGDSGGPVFNADGELVGINNAVGGLVQTNAKTYRLGNADAVVVSDRVVAATYVVELLRVKIDR